MASYCVILRGPSSDLELLLQWCFLLSFYRTLQVERTSYHAHKKVKKKPISQPLPPISHFPKQKGTSAKAVQQAATPPAKVTAQDISCSSQ